MVKQLLKNKSSINLSSNLFGLFFYLSTKIQRANGRMNRLIGIYRWTRTTDEMNVDVAEPVQENRRSVSCWAMGIGWPLTLTDTSAGLLQRLELGAGLWSTVRGKLRTKCKAAPPPSVHSEKVRARSQYVPLVSWLMDNVRQPRPRTLCSLLD